MRMLGKENQQTFCSRACFFFTKNNALSLYVFWAIFYNFCIARLLSHSLYSRKTQKRWGDRPRGGQKPCLVLGSDIYSVIDVGSDVTRNIRGASQSTKLWELQGGFPRSFRQGTKLQSITHQRKRPKFGFENTSDLFLIPTGLCFGVPHFEIRRSKIGMCSSKNSRFPCFQFL